MKRLALILAAAATTAFGPVAVDSAHAGDQDGGRGSSQGRGWERQSRSDDRGASQREVRGQYPERSGSYGPERRGQYPERGGRYVEGRRGQDPERGGRSVEDRRGQYPGQGGRYVEDRRGPPGPERGRSSDERRRPVPERGERYRDDGRARGRVEEPGPYGRGPPGYPAPYPRASGVRPGGYLPPSYRGAPVEDYRRYRLRPPPRGYNWVRVGDGFALVSPDGQIFDMVR